MERISNGREEGGKEEGRSERRGQEKEMEGQLHIPEVST